MNCCSLSKTVVYYWEDYGAPGGHDADHGRKLQTGKKEDKVAFFWHLWIWEGILVCSTVSIALIQQG